MQKSERKPDGKTLRNNNRNVYLSTETYLGGFHTPLLIVGYVRARLHEKKKKKRGHNLSLVIVTE